MSEYGGIYKGSVVNNADGEHRGRVIVKVPEVFGQADSNWCEPIWPTVYTPAVGEVVWVMFVASDTARPIYFSSLAVSASVIVAGSITATELDFVPADQGDIDNAQADATQALIDAATAIAAAAGAQATADGKVTTFIQATPPTAEGVGDLWVDSDDGNKLYRWNGSTWVQIQDTGITDALFDAANAQATADGKITTFYQASPPTADAIGDLWVDTDDSNKLYRWNGSTWQSARDAGIAQALADAATAIADAADAQATADGKIVTFIQTSAPTATATGDLWIDSDDANKLYRWNGSSWVLVRDSGIAAALLDASNAQATADGKITTFVAQDASPPTADAVGDLWVVTDLGNLVRRWDGAAWVDLAVGSEAIQPQSITSTHLDDQSVSTPHLAANLVLASLIKTAESGSRVEIGPTGVYLYDTSGTAVVGLPTAISDTNPAFFKGALEAATLILTGTGEIQGAVSITATSTVTLEAGITNPIASPLASVDWEQPVTFDISALLTAAGKTGSLSASNTTSISRNAANTHWIVTVRSGTSDSTVGKFDNAGAYVSTLANQLSPGNGVIYGATLIGTNWWLLMSLGSTGVFNLWKEPTTGVGGAVSAYSTVNTAPDSHPPTVGNDGTDCLVAEVDNTNTRYRIRRFAASGSPGTVAATMNSTGVTAPNETLRSVQRGNFDYGAERTVLCHTTAGANVAILNSSAAQQTSEVWPSTDFSSDGMGYDGTNFYSQVNGALYKHTNIKWATGTDSAVWWLAHTWKDTNATGGTHETAMSPQRSFTMKKRARLTAIPQHLPGGGGTDDPDHAGIYLGRGAGAPARTAMWYQGDSLAAGVFFSSVVFSAVANPPAANNFPATTGKGTITTPTGLISLKGDDTFTVASGGVASFAGDTLRANVVTGSNTRTAAPFAKIYKNSNQNVSTGGAGTGITLGILDEETDATFGDTANSRLVVPITGIYLVLGALEFDSSDDGRRDTRLMINGSLVHFNRLGVSNNAAAVDVMFGVNAKVPITWMGRLGASDTINLEALQTSGVTLAVIGGGVNTSWLSARWMSP